MGVLKIPALKGAIKAVREIQANIKKAVVGTTDIGGGCTSCGKSISKD